MKNKRGDIPVTILVIGVLAICGLAMFSFFQNINQTQDSLDDVELVEKANIEIEKGSLEEHYIEENETTFSFGEWFGERVVFSVDYSEPVD